MVLVAFEVSALIDFYYEDIFFVMAVKKQISLIYIASLDCKFGLGGRKMKKVKKEHFIFFPKYQTINAFNKKRLFWNELLQEVKQIWVFYFSTKNPFCQRLIYQNNPTLSWHHVFVNKQNFFKSINGQKTQLWTFTEFWDIIKEFKIQFAKNPGWGGKPAPFPCQTVIVPFSPSHLLN